MFENFNKKIKQKTQRGFTLVEMTIVAAIFGLMTAVVVYKYGDFTSNLLVSNMAYEIALTARQAQVFGVGVRAIQIDGEAKFDYPYGVYINVNDGSTNQAGESRSFILFADRDDDLLCDNGLEGAGFTPCTCAEGDECVDQFTLQRNIRITELRVGNENCLNIAGGVNAISVTFKRPSPEARIKRQDTYDEGFAFTQIKVEAPGSSISPSYVLIRNNGQISVSSENVCN